MRSRTDLRWGCLLLWLVLAVLPLRAWAQLSMHLPGPPSGPGHTSLPCHAAGHDRSDALEQSPSGCALCDLCHGSALPATEMPRIADPVAVMKDVETALAVTGIGRRRLERPPRG